MIEEKVKELIANSIEISVDQISLTDQLSDLGADSLTAIEIIVALEREFGVEVPQEFDPDSSVQELIEFVKNNT